MKESKTYEEDDVFLIPLKWKRGDDVGQVISLVNEQDEPMDFTGCRFDLHIKPQKKGEVIKLSSETGGIVVENGEVSFQVRHEQTENVTWELASWDLQCINAEGMVRTLCGGEIELEPDVTRRE